MSKTTAVPVSAEQARWFRVQRSGLVEPFDSTVAAARQLAGVQAQILPAAGLALWNRLENLDHERYERLLFEERVLVKLWGQRGTLHLYPSTEWPLYHAALAKRRSWWMRNAEDREAYEAMTEAVIELLEQRGSLSRNELRESDLILNDHHLSSWGGVFYEVVRRGVACHGPAQGGQGRFVWREAWLPDLTWEPPAPDIANQRIARRYFATYGPATVQDLAYWRGSSVGDAKRWVAALGDELAEVSLDGAPMLALRDDVDALATPVPESDAWPVKMLYRFDPLLLGLKDKTWIVDDAHYKRVWRAAGHIEGTILEQGRIVGTWRYQRRSNGLTVTLDPFAPLRDETRAVVERYSQGVADFFGVPLTGIGTRNA